MAKKNEDLLAEDKAPKAKAKGKKAKAEKGAVGRPASEKTQEMRKKIVQLARNKNGVANIDLAEKLGLTTAQSQTIARPLVSAGEIKLVKDKASGRVVYRAA